MKKSSQYLFMLAAICLTIQASAQMAFNTPAAFDMSTSLNHIEIEEDINFGITEFNVEASQDYLPFATPLFASDEEEDISNFLPFADPLFGVEDEASYLPIEENNGYFIESNNNTHSDFVVFSDNNFNEIIISLNADKQRTLDVSIFNAYGKQIIKNICNTKAGMNDINIEVENLTSGLYSMIIKSHHESVHRKFIIK